MDSCPTVPGQIGDVCDANPGPGFTLGELNGSCTCAAVPCTQSLTIEFQLDAFPGEVGWELRDQGSNVLIQSGAPGELVAANGIQTVNTCVPNGCYYLKVTDTGVNSAGMGGYILRTAGSPGIRIIDDRYNFSSGTLSRVSASTQQVATDGSFCIPMGASKTTFTSGDRLDWTPCEYVVCTPIAAVTAAFSTNPTNSGYDFWFYNPNGGYSFVRRRLHSVSDGYAPNDASRACHARINSVASPGWAPANYLQPGVLYNLRVRSLINGVTGPWGAATRFKMDPAVAACKLTKLQDDPSDLTHLSCNQFRAIGPSNYVWARTVTRINPVTCAETPANKYQFRFRIDAENVSIIKTGTGTNAFVSVTAPLVPCKTYTVEVRVSFDGGATWCIDTPTPTPGPNFVQWGELCNITTTSNACPPPVAGGNENLLMEDASTGSALHMYPNPNRGDQLYLSLEAVEEGVLTVSVDIYDLYGKRVSARTIPVQDGFINTVLDLDGDMASGMYMVNITAGEQRYTERLVIQR